MDLPNNSFFQYPSDYAPDKNKNFIWILLAGWIVFLIGGVLNWSPDPESRNIVPKVLFGFFIVIFITFCVLLGLQGSGYNVKKLEGINNIKNRNDKKDAKAKFIKELNETYKNDDGWPWSPPIKTPV